MISASVFPRLRRAPHGRRENQGRDHPLPEALHRPGGLPPPPPGRPLTPEPRGRPGPPCGCRIRAGLPVICRPSPALSSLAARRDLIRACVRHEALSVTAGGERPSISPPSWRRGEAGGSLIRGSPGGAGALAGGAGIRALGEHIG